MDFRLAQPYIGQATTDDKRVAIFVDKIAAVIDDSQVEGTTIVASGFPTPIMVMAKAEDLLDQVDDCLGMLRLNTQFRTALVMCEGALNQMLTAIDNNEIIGSDMIRLGRDALRELREVLGDSAVSRMIKAIQPEDGQKEAVDVAETEEARPPDESMPPFTIRDGGIDGFTLMMCDSNRPIIICTQGPDEKAPQGYKMQAVMQSSSSIQVTMLANEVKQ